MAVQYICLSLQSGNLKIKQMKTKHTQEQSRSIKELLILVKKTFETKLTIIYGLCSINTGLWESKKISRQELVILRNYFDDYAKSRKVFYNSYGHKTYIDHYYWKPFNKKPRINWLNKHIAKN